MKQQYENDGRNINLSVPYCAQCETCRWWRDQECQLEEDNEISILHDTCNYWEQGNIQNIQTQQAECTHCRSWINRHCQRGIFRDHTSISCLGFVLNNDPVEAVTPLPTNLNNICWRCRHAQNTPEGMLTGCSVTRDIGRPIQTCFYFEVYIQPSLQCGDCIHRRSNTENRMIACSEGSAASQTVETCPGHVSRITDLPSPILMGVQGHLQVELPEEPINKITIEPLEIKGSKLLILTKGIHSIDQQRVFAEGLRKTLGDPTTTWLLFPSDHIHAIIQVGEGTARQVYPEPDTFNKIIR